MSRHAHGCGDCIHNGCCVGLPHCGGSSWSPAYGECENCGGRVPLEDCEYQTEDGKHIFCSEGCLDEWLAEEEGREEMKCENCKAFAPNFKDEAYTSGCKYKCLLHGNYVRPEDESCHRFVIDPIQEGGAK